MAGMGGTPVNKSAKGHETSATGDGVNSATEGAGEKEEDSVVQVQTEVLS